ncbi:MAG: ABC transporter permease, partial [Chloroflexota bacterium]|nr:ABC transporter permease [Chloroflexota bacterium]
KQIGPDAPNLLFVRPGAASTGMVRSAQGSAATLTLEDAEAIANPSNVPSAELVAPEISTWIQVVTGSENVTTQILGVTAEYEEVRNYKVAEGSFITEHNEQARSMVCVLGSNVAEDLFGGLDPIGQRVKIIRRQFQVIGVLESKGGTGFGSQDDIVVVPITTAMYRLMPQRTSSGGHRVSLINVQAVDEDSIDAATEQITGLLRERHRITGEDDFTITSQQDILETMQEVTGVMTILLGSIAGIALLVGGIGIMNIMLVSVTERTREIGIRKAVGAKRRDILMQFLIESAVLSLSGGIVGLLIGWGFSRLISGINMGDGQSLTTVVSPDIVILAVGVAVGIGLFFGSWPAVRAARLNPIDALRYE